VYLVESDWRLRQFGGPVKQWVTDRSAREDLGASGVDFLCVRLFTKNAPVLHDYVDGYYLDWTCLVQNRGLFPNGIVRLKRIVTTLQDEAR